MSHKRRPVRNLTSEARIEAALNLLGILSAAAGQRADVQTVERELALTREQIEEIVALLQTLSHTPSGVRANLSIEGDEIALGGASAEIEPMRLTADEAFALSETLDRFRIDEGARMRIERALMPQGFSREELARTSSEPLFGTWFQPIAEALADGVRLEMSYRAEHDAAARPRIVDPEYFEIAGDAAYLVAWDVERDGERRYRLDRIGRVRATDDSVERHPQRRQSPAESIRAHGATALVRFDDRAAFDACDWAGLDAGDARTGADESVTAPVSYTAEAWLFDQVLASRGHLRIEAPDELRDRFVAYAQALLDA